ncbi:hypothetical protein OIU79_003897 [Salix purpurea]|uniref:Uncharacterized protein n=1 Tax=Salix purpurea TaxID=77065 RepID=A0A9Q0U943_SALPP|nr:hypothetical protein OIU79_003897 [Salix purpurea]
MFTLVYELVLHYMTELTHTFGNQLRKKEDSPQGLAEVLVLRTQTFLLHPMLQQLH